MPTFEPHVMEGILSYLRTNCAQMCRHWFNEIEVAELSQGTLTLLVKEPVRLKYLQRSCIDQFTEAAQAVSGRLLAVAFVGEEERPERAEDRRGGVYTQPDLNDEMILSPDYTFDSFVVGPDNRLAHAASLAVAQKPGKAYNPFFVHGGVGLGKTHLLQAISQMAIRIHGGMRIFYTSCNGFMTHFMEAVQAGQMTDFRHRFRNFDLLIVDDIHDLSKRGPSQEEFFHTFNSLYQAGRQIVLSSDAPPNEIPDLEERLTSRFNCGLVANIERPCYETRVAIVRSKAEMRNIQLPEDCAAYIASRLDSNIRELEGAITKLQGISLLEKSQIDMDLCKRAIGEQDSHTPGSPTTIQDILNTISDYYGLRITDLLSKRRHKSIALPRQIGMYLARKHTRFSLGEIGGYFGGRDHTTVMHAIRSIDSRRTDDRHLDDEVRRLEELIVQTEIPGT